MKVFDTVLLEAVAVILIATCYIGASLYSDHIDRLSTTRTTDAVHTLSTTVTPCNILMVATGDQYPCFSPLWSTMK